MFYNAYGQEMASGAPPSAFMGMVPLMEYKEIFMPRRLNRGLNFYQAKLDQD
jgi:hypothetical protein